MNSQYADLLASYGYDENPERFFVRAKNLEREGNLAMAATAYDRAYGLIPNNKEIAEARQHLLDLFAVFEYNIKFRYIPAGSFEMGSETGDPDEQPVHPVKVSEFWLSETPISWALYCYLMDWEAPPTGLPRQEEIENNINQAKAFNRDMFHLYEENKIRLQYCEDKTQHAIDWHAHTPEFELVSTDNKQRISSKKFFGEPLREDPSLPWAYNQKPMVSVSFEEAQDLCNKLSDEETVYSMPTEAEWEKAARGGLIHCRYPWGDIEPDETLCDFDHFERFSILPMRHFPPNGYGLHAMSGCVWEWTDDWYDADYYRNLHRVNPYARRQQGNHRVLRGGSWADCAEAVTVSYRMSCSSNSWRDQCWGKHFCPNIGFRLCRKSRS